MTEADPPSHPALQPTADDPWRKLRASTPARIALGRSGSSLPTAEVLGFGHAHALARDAVHRALDVAKLRNDLASLGLAGLTIASAAPDRATYLRRPDLGRQLAPADQTSLATAAAGPVDLAIVVADGLSSTAVQTNAVPLLAALMPRLREERLRIAPIIVATQARVALGDPVGAALRARMVLVLIGERPGLSSPDSLGAYLTFAPQLGRRDNERNCVSNIRAAGLTPERAAEALLWLIAEAFRRGLTGVALKDESGPVLLDGRTGTPGTLSAPGGADGDLQPERS